MSESPLNAADESAREAGCTCARNMPYSDWSHDTSCALHFPIKAGTNTATSAEQTKKDIADRTEFDRALKLMNEDRAKEGAGPIVVIPADELQALKDRVKELEGWY